MKYAIYIKCLYKNLPPTALQPIGSFRASLYMIAKGGGGGGIPRNLSEKKKKPFSYKLIHQIKNPFSLFCC